MSPVFLKFFTLLMNTLYLVTKSGRPLPLSCLENLEGTVIDLNKFQSGLRNNSGSISSSGSLPVGSSPELPEKLF